MTDPRPEPHLIALREGSKTAFDAVYAEHRTRVYGFLIRLCGDPHVAADLFQNVWLKLARFAPRLREDTNLRAWLLTIARREYIDYQRAQVFDLSRFLAWGRAPDLVNATGGLRQDIEQALQQLSDTDREVLLLVAMEDLSPKEAARVLGVTPVALRQRLSRARQRFASALEREQQPAHAPRTREGKARS